MKLQPLPRKYSNVLSILNGIASQIPAKTANSIRNTLKYQRLARIFANQEKSTTRITVNVKGLFLDVQLDSSSIQANFVAYVNREKTIVICQNPRNAKNFVKLIKNTILNQILVHQELHLIEERFCIVFIIHFMYRTIYIRYKIRPYSSYMPYWIHRNHSYSSFWIFLFFSSYIYIGIYRNFYLNESSAFYDGFF